MPGIRSGQNAEVRTMTDGTKHEIKPRFSCAQLWKKFIFSFSSSNSDIRMHLFLLAVPFLLLVHKKTAESAFRRSFYWDLYKKPGYSLFAEVSEFCILFSILVLHPNLLVISCFLRLSFMSLGWGFFALQVITIMYHAFIKEQHRHVHIFIKRI